MKVCVPEMTPVIPQAPEKLRTVVATFVLVGSLVALGGYAYFRYSIQISLVHAFFPTMEVVTDSPPEEKR